MVVSLSPPLAASARAADTYLGPDDPSSTLLPELNAVEVSTGSTGNVASATAAVQGVLDQIDAARQAQAEGELQEAELGRQLVQLQDQAAELNRRRDGAIVARNRSTGEANEAQGRAEAHQVEAAAAQALLDELAVQAYMGGNMAEDLLASPAFSTAGRKARYLQDVFDDQLARRGDEISARAAAQADQAAAAAQAAAHDGERSSIEAELAANAASVVRNGEAAEAARQAQRDAEAEQQRLAGVLVDAKTSLAQARRTATVRGADFPLVLLDAFVRAEHYEREQRPACNLSWTVLAALSKVESNHGTYGGSKVDALGQTSMIFGPQLAPGSGFATIADSDGGALDGDPLYDRAVGPMQFIPTSWRIFALDGDGDGTVDPRNYYDAALAAAEHLCRSGADTSSSAGLHSAVLGYNNSESYYATVMSIRNRYLGIGW